MDAKLIETVAERCGWENIKGNYWQMVYCCNGYECGCYGRPIPNGDFPVAFDESGGWDITPFGTEAMKAWLRERYYYLVEYCHKGFNVEIYSKGIEQLICSVIADSESEALARCIAQLEV